MEEMDPLERLVRAREELLDRQFLASVLEGKVYLDRERGEAQFTAEGQRRPARQRILLYLLARKALKALKAIAVEEAKPREMEGPTGLKGGTLRPKLKVLHDEGIVVRSDAGYYIPVQNLETAAEVIKEA